MFTEFPLPYYDFVKLFYEWLWSRCSILVYTIFHYPTRATFNTCSIIACPLVFTIHAKWYSLQPRGCSQTILHLCMPLTWIGKWGPVLECYTDTMVLCEHCTQKNIFVEVFHIRTCWEWRHFTRMETQLFILTRFVHFVHC